MELEGYGRTGVRDEAADMPDTSKRYDVSVASLKSSVRR